jgi:predicted Zn-dependent protease
MKNKFFNILFIISLLLLSACVTLYNPATQRQESYFINEKQEIDIGKNITDDILKQKKIITDKSLNDFVSKIGNKIAKAGDRPEIKYNFYILDEKEVNAFALPGGYIFVNKGLIDKMNEDELAFVLGHELGHVAARHSLKRLQSALGINLLLSVALGGSDYGAARQAAQIIYSIGESGYSRQDELLADSLGTKYIYRAGYNPYAGISAMQKLKSEGSEGNVPSFLRSHPVATERIKNIEKKIAELKTQ